MTTSDRPKIGDWVTGDADKPYTGRLDGFATIAGLKFACLILQDGTAANVGASTLRPADLADRILAAIEQREKRARSALDVRRSLPTYTTGAQTFGNSVTTPIPYVVSHPEEELDRCSADREIVQAYMAARAEYSADGRAYDTESETGRAATGALEEVVRILARTYRLDAAQGDGPTNDGTEER